MLAATRRPIRAGSNDPHDLITPLLGCSLRHGAAAKPARLELALLSDEVVRNRGPTGYVRPVYLAGLRIPDEDVRELIKLVDEPARSFLEKALALNSEVVALTIDDRERILWVLDDVRTEALAELRGVLLQEHEWRAREGLV